MMKKFLSAVLLSFSLAAFGAEPIVVNLWEGTNPPTDNGITPSDEVSKSPGHVSMVATPMLYIYPAENPNGTALLFCPGGGYAGLAMEHEGSGIAELLNPEGITVGVLKYRTPNQHPEVPMEDVLQGMKIMKAKAGELGYDASKIGIGGASAGGHLASTAATHIKDESLKPAFQVLLYPVISMDETITHGGSRKNLVGENPTAEMIEYYSNDLQVTPQTPSAFIVVSNDDTAVPVENSMRYVTALQKNGVPVSFHVYPVGGHGWGVRPSFRYYPQWTEELKAWLKN